MPPAAPLSPFGIAPLPGARSLAKTRGTALSLGSRAVTPAQAAGGNRLTHSNPTAPEPLPPPRSTPPVKGIGIQPLHTAKVGDFDRAAADPFARLFVLLEDRPLPKLDVRM